MCKKTAAIILSATPLFLGACTSISNFVSEYRIDVQQGNVVTQEMASQLKPGLTKDQVRFVLGSPLLRDPFHSDRWDYVYRLHKGKTNEVEVRQFSVFFDSDGKLERVSGDVVADATSNLAVPVESVDQTATKTEAVSAGDSVAPVEAKKEGAGNGENPEAGRADASTTTPETSPATESAGDSKVKVIDIGHIAEDGSYTPPPKEQPGFWSGLMNRLGF